MLNTANTSENLLAVRQFLRRQGLSCEQFSLPQLLADYLEEMALGLTQPGASSLKMIPAYVSPDRPLRRGRAALVLDAGGSNLRCALITLPPQTGGQVLLENFATRSMPALQQQFTAAEFFGEIANFMAPALAEYYSRYGQAPLCLGFCFSYPTQIVVGTDDNLGNVDGKLLQWSKEIKAPELLGQYIGSSLLAVLRQKFGAKAPRHVYLINDAVATLLAGQSVAADYRDFIGYILGTGINSCYAESSKNIVALDPRYRLERAIINVESGNYRRFPQSEIDREHDSLTQDPGAYLQEKSCSGRYWGELVCVALRGAATCGLLPAALAHVPRQNSATLNAVLQEPSWPRCGAATNPLLAWLDEHNIAEAARERIYFVTEAMLERSALFTAVNMAACMLRSAGGRSPLQPICVTVDGATFYALHRFEQRVHVWLDLLLEGRCYYRLQSVANAPLLGAAIVSLAAEAAGASAKETMAC